MENDEYFFKVLFLAIKLQQPQNIHKLQGQSMSESDELYNQAKARKIKFFQYHEFISHNLERQQHNIDKFMQIDQPT